MNILIPLTLIVHGFFVVMIFLGRVKNSHDVRKMDGIAFFSIVLFFNVYFVAEYIINKIGI